MNGPQLVSAYNAMASSLGEKPVKRFGTRSDGIRRCNELFKKVNGAQAGPKSSGAKKIFKREREFGIGKGSNRSKLLAKLLSEPGTAFPLNTLVLAVYGTQDASGINGVLKGVMVMLERSKAPYEIVRSKNEKKESCFAIQAKSNAG